MARQKAADSVSNKKEKKDSSFSMLNNHEIFPDVGWYLGTIHKIKRVDNYLQVSAEVKSLDDVHNYGIINGFLPISYSDEDLTAEFMEAFDNPKKFSEVIGKEAKVYVEFKETEDGREYANIVSFEKT